MIRVLSIIGHGLDLIPHFINHYSKHVDEIQFVVYETDMYPTLANEVKEIVQDEPKVKIVQVIKDRVFDWEKVTKLYNFHKNKKPNDWWIIADIDEFHLYSGDDLRKVIDNCEEGGWDIVRGGFIDRIGVDGVFPEIVKNVPIFEQFPVMGFFRYPMSRACPNKICIMKGYVELTAGQHYAKIDGQTTWKWQGWNHPLINPNTAVQVHHFKWDSTAIDRIKAVADIKQAYAYSDEYKLMFEQIRKNKFKINIKDPDYMIEVSDGQAEFSRYRQWNKLIKKIMSI